MANKTAPETDGKDMNSISTNSSFGTKLINSGFHVTSYGLLVNAAYYSTAPVLADAENSVKFGVALASGAVVHWLVSKVAWPTIKKKVISANSDLMDIVKPVVAFVGVYSTLMFGYLPELKNDLFLESKNLNPQSTVELKQEQPKNKVKQELEGIIDSEELHEDKASHLDAPDGGNVPQKSTLTGIVRSSSSPCSEKIDYSNKGPKLDELVKQAKSSMSYNLTEQWKTATKKVAKKYDVSYSLLRAVLMKDCESRSDKLTGDVIVRTAKKLNSLKVKTNMGSCEGSAHTDGQVLVAYLVGPERVVSNCNSGRSDLSKMNLGMNSRMVKNYVKEVCAYQKLVKHPFKYGLKKLHKKKKR